MYYLTFIFEYFVILIFIFYDIFCLKKRVDPVRTTHLGWLIFLLGLINLTIW